MPPVDALIRQHSYAAVKTKVYHALGTCFETIPVIKTLNGVSLAPLPHVFGNRKPIPCRVTINSGSPSPNTFLVFFVCGATIPINHQVQLATGVQWKAMAVVVRTASRDGGEVVNMRSGDDCHAVEALVMCVILACNMFVPELTTSLGSPTI